MAGQEDDSYIPNYFGPGEDLDNRASGSPDNHGIYVSKTSGTTYITDNLIYDNGERGEAADSGATIHGELSVSGHCPSTARGAAIRHSSEQGGTWRPIWRGVDPVYSAFAS